MAGCNCIDVSEHNGNINWEAVKNDGVDYALIRCGFGRDIESQDDKYFHINMEGALNAGLKVGVYFYSYADYGDAAAEEAEHCLRLINGYKDKLSLPVFYDLEEDKCKNKVYDIYTMFEAILKEAGYNVGCYASQYWFNTCLKPVPMDYTWVAKWDGAQPDWGCSIWQFTGSGHCAGVYGNVDCDVVLDENMKALIPVPDVIPDPVDPDVPSDNEVSINIKIKVPEGTDIKVNVDQ